MKNRWMPAALLLAVCGLLLVVVVQAQEQRAMRGQLEALTRAQSGYLKPAKVDNPILLRGCVIRFDKLSSTGKSVQPRILANSGHICVGVQSVTIDWGGSGDLLLRDSPSNEPVIVAFAEEDETLTARGIQCGPSGGAVQVRIACYKGTTRIPGYSKQLYGRYANLWVGVQNWAG